jgi:hypothetical protein
MKQGAFSEMKQVNEEILPQEDHRIPIGEDWAIWRCACLRSAGFPAETVMSLSDSACSVQADQVIATESRLDSARNQADQALRQALDTLRSENRWSDKKMRHSLINAQKAVKGNRRPKPVTEPVAAAAIRTYLDCLDHLNQAIHTYRQCFAEAEKRLSTTLTTLAQSETFQEAIIWQNRRLLHGSAASVIQGDTAVRGAVRRRREASVARYLQRYCTKNDTIGFFGPVGWALLTTEGQPFVVRPGRHLLKERHVYFEDWAMQALADTLAQDERLKPWMVPRPMPFLYQEGDSMELPMAGRIALPPEQAVVLRACDGKRTAKEVAQHVSTEGVPGLTKEADVYEVLQSLRQQRRLAWTYELPVSMRPEVELQKQLERIEDPHLRSQAEQPLQALLQARDEVARSAGDPERLDGAMGQLEETFTRWTGKEPTRNHGQTYGARTLVYEECVRDVAVQIGPTVWQEAARPLSLLLTSVRWFTAEVAAVYESLFSDIYHKLAHKSGRSAVSFAEFCLWAHPYLFNEKVEWVTPVVAEYQKRWAEILSLPEGENRVWYTAKELQPLVQKRFATTKPRWEAVRFHSPDIMIAAADTASIRSGDVQLILGEMHLGLNTLGVATLFSHHPEPEQLMRAFASDHSGPRIVPVVSKDWGMTGRTSPFLATPQDLRLMLSHDACGVDSTQALAAGELTVEKGEGGLVVRSRRGKGPFPLLDVLTETLLPSLTDCFRMISPRRHTPRVSIDRLTVMRESWRFSATELSFAYIRDRSDRYLAARRWLLKHDLPRHVFVGTPVERKPFFVDWDSPILVDMFAQAIRDCEGSENGITISEMLPDLNQLWLSDGQGQRYTSELRLVAVDIQR